MADAVLSTTDSRGWEHMESIIKIDESLCINCGNCIRCCPGGLITQGQFPVPTSDSWGLCIDCGHCVAICPTGAMHQRSMGPEDCEPIDLHHTPTWEQVRHFLISRRSIRGYINKPIEKEKIEQLLDVSRYAPNGSNRQTLRWLVIIDPAEVRRIAAMTIDWMKDVEVSNPALFKEAKLAHFVSHWDAGRDHISRGAPCIIQAYAPEDERTAAPAAFIAIAHIQLAATALGLGTSFTESIGLASRSYPPLLEALGQPEGEIPYATFLIGYPTEHYLRVPKRKAVDVIWH